jgi:hypothetical protein
MNVSGETDYGHKVGERYWAIDNGRGNLLQSDGDVHLFQSVEEAERWIDWMARERPALHKQARAIAVRINLLNET